MKTVCFQFQVFFEEPPQPAEGEITPKNLIHLRKIPDAPCINIFVLAV